MTLGTTDVLPRSGWRPLEDLRSLASGVYQHRFLLFQITTRDLRLRYRQTVMGFAWALLMPIMVVAASMIIRTIAVSSAVSSSSLHAVGATLLKASAWGFFAGALSFGVNSLTSSGNLVAKTYFPRAVLPLGAVLTQASDSTIAATIAIVALPFLGVWPSPTWLWAVPLVLLLVALTTSLCLLLAAANVFFRDVKYLVQILLTFGILFTPVLYDAPALGITGASLLLALNPLAPLCEGLRLSLVENHDLLAPIATHRQSTLVEYWHPAYLVSSTAITVLIALVSSSIFVRAETQFAERA